jgi:lysophospholipase L1-like esterase
VLFGLLCSLLPTPTPATTAFELADGDRVVLVGSTLIEREQRYGYWETALTRHYARCNITFRNLGWSGDTVWGEARAGFDTPKEGFKRLVEHTLALKPTVIILGYGTNEAFAGAAGLPRFRDGLNALLDALLPAKARMVLLAPLPLEKLPPPLPDPTAQNQNIALYCQAIRQIAAERRAVYFDVFDRLRRLPLSFDQWHRVALPPTSEPLTDNGVHLTAYGYWRTAPAWLADLGYTRRFLRVSETAREFELPRLPYPPPPKPDQFGELAPLTQHLRWEDLHGQPHTIYIDGRPEFKIPPAELTGEGYVQLTRGPDIDQVERLRRTIVEKNRLYFHRWRPQNETYLFGFRKHEQGQNAREIPQFDPLVAKLEAEIARLRVPVFHRYELVPEKKP